VIVKGRNRATRIAELLRLARDEDVSPDRARSVGAELADHYLRAGKVEDTPLAEFTADAYLGFDARIAEVQAKAGRPRRP